MRLGYLVLVVAILLAFWRFQPPSPLPVSAPAGGFSASRAFGDVKAIAQRPHPVGSVEHERVKTHLVTRLSAMGLQPQVQTERALVEDLGHSVSAPVSNIIGVLPGADRTLPAVLLMCHYDTVPGSPGAADDSAGVATTLEVARALKSGPKPQRDVVFLFTDGEELGLVGAHAFFRKNPLAHRIGAVINLEARGDAGLTAMFETGSLNADAVSRWAEHMSRPSANSLSTAIYKHMPNGTDFTIAAVRGLPGLNFAFMGDEVAYHSPLATPAHLNLGSLQHMGDGALAAAQAFAEHLPEQKEDSIYSDFLGLFVIQYTFVVGWILFAVTALLTLYAILAAEGVTDFDWGRGFLNMLVAFVLPVALLWLASLGFGGRAHFLRLAHFDYLMAGAGFVAVGAGLFGAGLFQRRRPSAVWQWVMLVLLALAAVAQIYLPEGSYAVVWPLLAAATIAVIRFVIYRGEDSIAAVIISAVIAVVVVAQVTVLAMFAFTALGVDLPVVLAAPVLLVLPLLLLIPGKAPSRSLSVVTMLAGAGLFVYALTAPATAQMPLPSSIRYGLDQNSGKAYRIDYLNVGDEWTKAALGEGAAQAPLSPFSERAIWHAETKSVAVAKSDLVFARDGTSLMIVVKPAPGASLATVWIKPPVKITGSNIDGEEIKPLEAGVWTEIEFFAPGPDGFIWTMPVPKSGPIEVRMIARYPSWPKGAELLPSLPDNKMAFKNNGATEVALHRVWKP